MTFGAGFTCCTICACQLRALVVVLPYWTRDATMLVGESEQNIQDRVESGDICQSEKERVAKKKKQKNIKI